MHRQKAGELDYGDGPSLLTLKVDALLEYVQNLALLTASRLLTQEASAELSAGQQALVDTLIRNRLILEKVRPLEKGLKYQIERMLRAAMDAEASESKTLQGTIEEGDPDLLAYGPGMSSAFQAPVEASRQPSQKSKKTGGAEEEEEEEPDVYRPPKLAAVAYDPDAKRRRRQGEDGDEEEPSRTHKSGVLLSELTASMSGVPLEEGASGTGVSRPHTAGGGGIGASKRARDLARMQEYEEENFTRLALSKREQRRRERDEADFALGGARGGRGQSGQRAGFESELAGLLGDERERSSSSRKGKKSKKNDRPNIDVYDQLRSSATSQGPRRQQQSKRKAADLGGDSFQRHVREKRGRR